MLLESPTANAREKASIQFALGLLKAGDFSSQVRRLWDDPSAREELPLWKWFNEPLGAYVAFGRECQFQDWRFLQPGDVVKAWGELAEGGVKERLFLCEMISGGVVGKGSEVCGKLHRQELDNQILKPMYAEFLRVRASTTKLLSACFEEQLQVRMLGQETRGDVESLPQAAITDPVEERVARELCKQWLAAGSSKSRKAAPAARMPALRFLQGQLQQQQQHDQHAQQRPSEEASKDSASPAAGAAPPQGVLASDEMPDTAAPCAAAAPAAPNQDQSAEQGDAPSQDDREDEPSDRGCKRDMHGNLVRLGDMVVVHAKKSKEKFDKRPARVVRLTSQHAKVQMASGPAKDTMHRVLYHSIEKEGAVPDARQLSSMQCVRSSSGPASEVAAPAAEVPDSQPDTDTQNDPTSAALCLRMFGNLGDFS